VTNIRFEVNALGVNTAISKKNKKKQKLPPCFALPEGSPAVGNAEGSPQGGIFLVKHPTLPSGVKGGLKGPSSEKQEKLHQRKSIDTLK